MSVSQVTVAGTLRADGTLELAERPDLPAGPVEVVIRPSVTPPEARVDWWDYLQQARAELEAAGLCNRTAEEIDAEITELREWDDRLDEVHRQIEEERRRGDHGAC